MKPARRIRLNPRLKDKVWKKKTVLPGRVWAVAGAFVLVFTIGWCMLAPDQRETPRTTTPSTGAAGNVGTAGIAGTAGTANGQSPASSASPDAGIPGKELLFIRTVRLEPSRPTRTDTLKAEVEVAPTAPERLVFTYQWKVNDQVIGEATEDTLNLSPFKKGDLITVIVTPNEGGTKGFAVESPLVAVHSAPPSLELKTVRQARKTGEPIVLQLVGAVPDGELVAFSLEPPLVPGMTIDKRSGKISWLLPPDQKGSFRFGASVEDDKGTKVTKTFDITAE